MAKIAAGAVFVFAVSGPGSTAALGIDGVERSFWIAADLMTAVALLQDRRIGALASSNPSLLAWAVLAMLSSLWSLTPGPSLYQGLQLLMTLLVGYWGCTLLDFRRLLVTLVLGQALGEGASILALVLHPASAISGQDGTWLGVYPHKNELGSMMTLQIITCSVLIIDGRYRRLAVGSIVPAIVLLLGSRSGTSLLSLALSLAFLPLLLCYRRSPRSFGICIGVMVLGGAALAEVLMNGGNLIAAVLGQLGKDDTLTGRTVLWQFGFDQIRATPVIGIGYKAYWESSATSAAYLRYVVGQDLWFFHNNFVDVGVAFGGVGLAVFCWGLLTAVVRSFSIVARNAEPIQLWRPIFVIYVIVEATAECPLFQNHSLHQLLLVIATTWPAAAAALPWRPAYGVTMREARS